VQYGYRVTSEQLPPLPEEVRPGCSIKVTNVQDHLYRPCAVALPLLFEGVALPRPDMNHAASIAMGAQKRIVNPLPQEMDHDVIVDFGKFCQRKVEELFKPLEADADTGVDHWLANSSYTLERQQDLRKLVPEEVNRPLKHVTCKSFIKDEFYLEYKYPRTINPRDDYFKVYSGPIFHLIEQVVFKHEYFIKKVPLDQRPAYIKEKVYKPGFVYQCTDYTSFESSFTGPLMRNCEMILYRHMTKNLPMGESWCDNIEIALTGPQKLKFKKAVVRTIAGRCSGDMCTSLGNGFTNMMLMLYCAEKQELGELFAVFEGDDGLCRFSSGRTVDPMLLRQLGFTVKMEIFSELAHASFCGMIFDPDSCQQIGDPRRFAAALGWTSAKYIGSRDATKKALLRAKALSGLYQFPACPIITALCRRIIFLTSQYSVARVLGSRNTNWWERVVLKDAILFQDVCQEITLGTRLLMEHKYGISVEEQVRIEQQFGDIQMGLVNIDLDYSRVWTATWDRYVITKPSVVSDPWHPGRQLERSVPS